jgi:hypothetical protein
MITMSRNIAQDLRAMIDKEISEAGPVWTAAEIAARVVAKLRVYDPELLTKWLDAHAVPVVRETVNAISRAERTAVRARPLKSTSKFQQAVARHEGGDKTALSGWLSTDYVVNDDNQRKRLGDMERHDLLYAASAYTKRAKYSSMQAAFLRALSERVGSGTVEQVFSDEDLARLWHSLS